jgi:hypothetical protein
VLVGLLLTGPARAEPLPRPSTFAQAGDQAVATILDVFYAGNGLWRLCDVSTCPTANQDWGADSLTYALYLRWQTTHERALVPVMRALLATAPSYQGPCTVRPCTSWSDVPEWDAVAALREYAVTGHDPLALEKAKAAFNSVQGSIDFSLGACPGIRFQQPDGAGHGLKTLESDANSIKAALLLYQALGNTTYLDSAIRTYAAVRAHFLDHVTPLYSVFVFDNGTRCTQLAHRFFASVNGDMIWNGLELSRDTKQARYLEQATATAKAVVSKLADPAGVFADLQAENDIVEPLVEAMYDLATQERAAFARAWILRNAAAAVSARAPNGAIGRFFDGPPPSTKTTIWQANGGLAILIAAAALDPTGRIPTANPWAGARYVPDHIAKAPASVTFTGREIAFYGTLGEVCCQPGHARVFVDGVETFDHTGIWQNKSSLGEAIPRTVLFAWRWPHVGVHTITFEPGLSNGKEGGSFLDLQGYLVR